MIYRKDRNGNELSMLGFGCMRFTRKGSSIDVEKAESEIMAAYHAGVNYYDTAYIYPGSEAALGEIFERNHIREKINIATKLSPEHPDPRETQRGRQSPPPPPLQAGHQFCARLHVQKARQYAKRRPEEDPEKAPKEGPRKERLIEEPAVQAPA